jgi:hypothetical protein
MPRTVEEDLAIAWRGGAPTAGNNSREVAKYVATGQCPTRGLCLAAGVSTDRLLRGTRYEVPFGQSPFAIQRGRKVEEVARAKDAEAIRLRAEAEFGSFPRWGVVDISTFYKKPNWDVGVLSTYEVVAQVLAEDASAPSLIFGAAFAYELKRRKQHYEADVLLVTPRGVIHVVEIKSFPKVAGQADGKMLGEAVAQASIYLLALRELVSRLGGDPSQRVSDEVLVFTPENFRLRLTSTKKNVARRARYTEEALRLMPSVSEFERDVPRGFTFGEVADCGREESERVAPLERVACVVGTTFGPECLGNCGLFRFCRERQYRDRKLAALGPEVTNLLPGVETWDEALELSEGRDAGLPPNLRVIADRLARARRLIDEAAAPVASHVRRVR